MSRSALALKATPVTEIIETPALTLTLDATIAAACKRIAPLWPLKTFVAVNPFLGFTGGTFAHACATFERVARTRMLMCADVLCRCHHGRPRHRRRPRRGTRRASAAGARHRGPEGSRQAPRRKPARLRPPSLQRWPKFLIAARMETGMCPLVAFMIEEISAFCAAYFDEGQANWPLPVRKLPPYAAWRALAVHDRNPEAMGLAGFRRAWQPCPTSVAAIGVILDGLGIPKRAHEDYLFRRSSTSVAGRPMRAMSAGMRSSTVAAIRPLVGLLAVRLAWGWALFSARKDTEFREAWAKAMANADLAPEEGAPAPTRDLSIDLILQEAFDIGARRRILAQLGAHTARLQGGAQTSRPAVQAAFCIDVRSSVPACPRVRRTGRRDHRLCRLLRLPDRVWSPSDIRTAAHSVPSC